MVDSPTAASAKTLELLPYHRAMIDHLHQVDPHVWNWFSKHITDPKSVEELRFELLKSTYRVDRDSQPESYEMARAVAKLLAIDAPITIYQSQNPQGMNASLAYVPGELHLILHGPIAERLTPVEIQGLFAHEIAHYVLWQLGDSQLLTAHEMLQALTNDFHAHQSHFASLRLLDLYIEVFCDRASYLATRDLNSVVSMLVKVHTGVQDVNPESYLRQADEIFAHGPAATQGLTHPEAFIRARAIRLWAENAPDIDAQVYQMIEGSPGIDELDLLAQQQVAAGTRRLLDALLCHAWFQTDVVLAHARLYFEDYVPPGAPPQDREWARQLRTQPDSLRDYWCFVLLDFASADRDLDHVPLAKALVLAEQLEIKPRFMELARQELRLRKNQIENIDQQKEKLLADADRSVAAQA